MFMGSVFKFVRNMWHKTHDDSLAEYYRLEYQNDPLLYRKIKMPLGDWWYVNKKL